MPGTRSSLRSRWRGGGGGDRGGGGGGGAGGGRRRSAARGRGLGVQRRCGGREGVGVVVAVGNGVGGTVRPMALNGIEGDHQGFFRIIKNQGGGGTPPPKPPPPLPRPK